MNTALDYVLYFFFYSFLGWVVETIYCSIGEKKFVNRGFLTGPLCPIYGTGAVVFGVCLMPFYNKFGYSKWYIILLVVLLGMLLADAVEFFTSLIMEKLFNARWWDYSNEKFNIQGRICLKHTLYWGLASGIFIYVVHPRVINFISGIIDDRQRNQILIMIFIVFAFDLFFAVKGAFDVRKLINKINRLHAAALENANSIKSNVAQKYEDIHDSVEKGGFKIAVWAADISRQISEIEKPSAFKKKHGKRRTKAEQLVNTRLTLKNTIEAKLKDIRSLIEEYTEKELPNDENEHQKKL